MADGVWKEVQPQVIGHFKQLLQNKFFDPSTPSMRKGRDGEWKKWNGKKIASRTIVAKDNNFFARSCKSQKTWLV